MEFKVKNIAELLNGTIVGNEDISLNNISKIEDGKPGTLAFLANMKYEKYIYTTKASAVLVSNDFIPEQELNCTIIKVADPYQAIAELLNLYQESKPRKFGIEEGSNISKTAKIGDNVYIAAFAYIDENVTIGNGSRIFPHTYIGSNVKIGKGTIIYAGAKIYSDCIIGDNCIIHAGAVIGSDGFGFAPAENGKYKKIEQVGNVILEDDVEIGANTTIDCSTMGSTIIHKGAKLDNLIQIAHNCEIGENTVIAAHVAIAGSTKVGDNCVFGGNSAVAGHLNIGNNVKIGGMSGISNSIKDGKTVLGLPATDYTQAVKGYVIQRRLPELKATVDKLEKELAELKAKLK